MNWNRHKSVMLSKVFVVFFAAMILAMYGYCIFRIFVPAPYQIAEFSAIKIIICICSIPAWAALYGIWQILKRMQSTTVFSRENVRSMRLISWCCMMVAVICFFSAAAFPMLLLVSSAAAFMGLIVRIVKDAFQQALEMKDELDYTV